MSENSCSKLKYKYCRAGGVISDHVLATDFSYPELVGWKLLTCPHRLCNPSMR
jgi:hypothetical protein